jgi:hypothetical protein
MRSIEEVRDVLSLIGLGFNDCEISRKTRIPRGTVRDWRYGKLPRLARSPESRSSCPECGHPAHDFSALPGPDYSYLLGLYLGDGYISEYPRTHRLTVYLDRGYPLIVKACAASLAAVMPTSKPGKYRRPDEQLDEVYSYSKAWPCLFPQHGPGKKHLRSIKLRPWQKLQVRREPERFLRGLIHTDGCRVLNVIKHPKRTYVYPRYEFTNTSDDIRWLFCDTCDQLGINWSVMNAKTIAVAKRDSVAAMDEFIGPKK